MWIEYVDMYIYYVDNICLYLIPYIHILLVSMAPGTYIYKDHYYTLYIYVSIVVHCTLGIVLISF